LIENDGDGNPGATDHRLSSASSWIDFNAIDHGQTFSVKLVPLPWLFRPTTLVLDADFEAGLKVCPGATRAMAELLASTPVRAKSGPMPQFLFVTETTDYLISSDMIVSSREGHP